MQQQRQQQRQLLGLQMAIDGYANARVSLPAPFASVRDQLLLAAVAPGVGAAALSASPPSPALTPTQGPPASQLSSSRRRRRYASSTLPATAVERAAMDTCGAYGS